MTDATAIAAGWTHSVALKNDGTVVAWGDNTYGQTNVPVYLAGVKLIAVGGDHTLAGEFSTLVQYNVDVTKDLLLIYNTNSLDSSNVCAYYLAHRPMVSNANVLGIASPTSYGAPTNETATPDEFTNKIANPVLQWLTNNPTKRPQYVILFPDIPSRVNDYNEIYPNPDTNGPPIRYRDAGIKPSVSVQLRTVLAGWAPFVTHLNMGMTNAVNRTNDCIGYINKLATLGTPVSTGSPVLSASARGYANTNYVVDDVHYAGYAQSTNAYVGNLVVASATNGLLAAGVATNAISFLTGIEDSTPRPHLTSAANLAGYISWGFHSSLESAYAIGGHVAVKWSGNSRWWIIETLESHNGMRVSDSGNFLQWFSSAAFGGTNYANTPVGAVSHVDEPGLGGVNNSATYFSLWTSGRRFSNCAWASYNPPATFAHVLQVVGDPFVTK